MHGKKAKKPQAPKKTMQIVSQNVVTQSGLPRTKGKRKGR